MRNGGTNIYTYYQWSEEEENTKGEEQKKLDIISNDIMKDALKWSGQLATLASEEEDTPVGIEVSAEEADFWGWGSDSVILDNTGRYVAVFDPLDGSSNVDAGIPVGTSCCCCTNYGPFLFFFPAAFSYQFC